MLLIIEQMCDIVIPVEVRAVSREKSYIAIDLKSFFASCECIRLGLDPLKTNLVVADDS